MFKEERDNFQFRWEDLGNIEEGRPNLGTSTSLLAYRLMQFTLRDVLIKEYNPETAARIFRQAGALAGSEFCAGREEGAPGEECYELVVEDNGIGFDQKYSERIFGVFQRLHGRQEYEGSGIGLSICKKIVERHRGTIAAHSTPGQGTSVVMILPVRQPR